MNLPITPENFAAVLIAAGTGASAVLTAIGGWALWKKQKEPPPVGSPDALVLGLAKLTQSMDGVGGQFGNNLQMFGATVVHLKSIEADLHSMTKDLEKIKELQHDNREHLSAIRDALNRRQR